MENSITFIRI
nr:unnamed protein product [Callosobruchus analis]